MPVSSTTQARFWLAGVDVMASEQTGVIVALGESIVDGSQSTVDANARWTDQLARRLLAQPGQSGDGRAERRTWPATGSFTIPSVPTR